MILKKNKDMDFLMIGSVALKTLNVSAVINYTVGDFRNILIGCITQWFKYPKIISEVHVF